MSASAILQDGGQIGVKQPAGKSKRVKATNCLGQK